MPILPVLKGPAPSSALTSFSSSCFRDSPRCTFSRPFAQTTPFLFWLPPTPRPDRSAFISHSATLGRPAGLLSPTAPAGPITFTRAFIFCPGRPVRLPSHTRRPRTHLPAFRPPLGAGLAPPAGLKVRLPPAALCSSRRRPRPARRARDLWNTTPRGRQSHTTLFSGRSHSPALRLTRALFVFMSINGRTQAMHVSRTRCWRQCHRRKYDHLARCDLESNETRNSGLFRCCCDKR